MPVTTVEKSPEVVYELLDERMLRQAAGYRNYHDGEMDFDSGFAESRQSQGQAITVTVRSDSGDVYTVQLEETGDKVTFRCSCSAKVEMRRICRHSVCAAMAVMYDEFPEEDEKKDWISRATLRSYLEDKEKESLIMLLLERQERDLGLKNTLSIRASAMMDKTERAELVRSSLDRILRNIGRCRLDELYLWEVRQVVDALDELCSTIDPGEALELVEYGLESALQVLKIADDPDDVMTDVFDLLLSVHSSAAERAKKPSVDLARLIFELELHDVYGVLEDLVSRYHPFLSESGIDEYQRLVQIEWDKFEAGESHCDDCALNVFRMMENVIALGGDLEKLIEWKSKELSLQDDYLEIARIYEKEGNPEKALEWAERGYRECDGSSEDVRDYMLDLLLDNGKTTTALELLYEEFMQSPEEHTYDELKGVSERLGEWPAWRQKALEYWQQALADKRVKRTRDMNSALVEAFIAENESEKAWAIAKEFGCAEHLWYELAVARESTHPADAVPVYQKRVEHLLGLKQGIGYPDAARLVGKLKDLMKAAGKKDSDYSLYLNTLKSKNKSRREFLELLKQ